MQSEVDVYVDRYNQVSLYAVQGESNSRDIIFNIIEQDGVQIPTSNATVIHKMLDLTGYTPRLYIQKPDGTAVFIEGQVLDAAKGKISFTLTNQSVAANGVAQCTIVLTAANKDLRAVGIAIEISESILDDVIESSDDFGALQQALSDVSNAINGANSAATRADTAASNANVAATNVANAVSAAVSSAANADLKAKAANDAATDANGAAAAANTAAEIATSAATDANGAAAAANIAAENASIAAEGVPQVMPISRGGTGASTASDAFVALSEDTGWQDLDDIFNTQYWTNSATSINTRFKPVEYRRIGKQVFIDGFFKCNDLNNSFSTEDEKKLFALPAGYRPRKSLYWRLPMSGQQYAKVYVTEGGTVGMDFTTATALTASTWFNFNNVSFFVD